MEKIKPKSIENAFSKSDYFMLGYIFAEHKERILLELQFKKAMSKYGVSTVLQVVDATRKHWHAVYLAEKNANKNIRDKYLVAEKKRVLDLLNQL